MIKTEPRVTHSIDSRLDFPNVNTVCNGDGNATKECYYAINHQEGTNIRSTYGHNTDISNSVGGSSDGVTDEDQVQHKNSTEVTLCDCIAVVPDGCRFENNCPSSYDRVGVVSFFQRCSSIFKLLIIISLICSKYSHTELFIVVDGFSFDKSATTTNVMSSRQRDSDLGGGSNDIFLTKNDINPNKNFRDTKFGEISIIASSSSLSQKNCNADIVCLQEVKGNSKRELLEMSSFLSSEKGQIQYDKYVWSPLYPHSRINNDDDSNNIGLCVLWSSTKFRLITSKDFKRGLVVQLQEIRTDDESMNGKQTVGGKYSRDDTSGAMFCIANVHLPTNSSVEENTKIISTLCHKIEDLRSGNLAVSLSASRIGEKEKTLILPSSLDGTVFVAGTNLCRYCHGLLQNGVLNDTNNPSNERTTVYSHRHKQKISVALNFKSINKKVKHSLRFINAYDLKSSNSYDATNEKIDVQSVTTKPTKNSFCLYFLPGKVGERSLSSSAGKGGMQKLLSRHGSNKYNSIRKTKKVRDLKAKRGSSGKNAEQVQNGLLLPKQPPSLIRVESLIKQQPATRLTIDDESLTLIVAGALFTPLLKVINDSVEYPLGIVIPQRNEISDQHHKQAELLINPWLHPWIMSNHGISISTRKSRTNRGSKIFTPHRTSSAIIKEHRHNLMLQCVITWLMENSVTGITDVIRDRPLYQWKWIDDNNEYDPGKKEEGGGIMMKTPDICCVIPRLKPPTLLSPSSSSAARSHNGFLVMIEVAISNAPRCTREQKLEKYKDVSQFLSESPIVQKTNLKVLEPFIIIVDDSERDGKGPIMPTETMNELQQLLVLLTRSSAVEIEEEEKKEKMESAWEEVSAVAERLLKIRDHWSPRVSGI